ncbi:unnamed protein product, partial [Polarella glacialis]
VLPMLQHFAQPGSTEQFALKVKFIGYPGVCVTDETDRRKLTEALAPYSCIPVFMEQDVVDQHKSFCEDFLWPVFHNMKIFDTATPEAGENYSESFDKAKWKNFMALNNAYAEVITSNGDANTLVWVHDYELILVPRYVFHRCPSWTVGLFLHCSFPSVEVLRCLPNREEILQSMLSARLVTFQIFDYLRHFMSCCSELLGSRHSFQKGGILQVEHDSRSVVVFADHFTLPYQHLVKKLSDDTVMQRVKSLRDKFPGKTIIGSYDRCDLFAGLALKLRTFHRFVAEYRQYRRSVVLVQYIRTYRRAGNGKALVDELEKMADETNKAFGVDGEPPLVTIVVEDAERDKILGVYSATDILLDTSINDGLNLGPFMFYAAHSQDKKGVAIVSEFSGCSTILTGTFKVNPWNTNAVLAALDQALSITPMEQETRFVKDHSYVSSQTLVQWVSKNLTELKVTRSNG